MAISGLFGRAAVFAEIADQWERNLAGPYPPGRIDYFKMDEAVTLDGCFRHWNIENRDKKVLQLAQLIDRRDLVQITARIDLRSYARFTPEWEFVRAKPGELEKHHSMSQPYIMLFQIVMIGAVTEALDRGETRPIEIVFDKQEILKPSLVAGYESLRKLEASDPQRLALMPLMPGFRDDRDFVMLQAVDMLAGERRLAAEDYPDNPPFIGKLCPNLPFSRYSRAVGDKEMEGVHAHLLASVEREERERDAIHKGMTCGD